MSETSESVLNANSRITRFLMKKKGGWGEESCWKKFRGISFNYLGRRTAGSEHSDKMILYNIVVVQ